jgi:hypothetical protein
MAEDVARCEQRPTQKREYEKLPPTCWGGCHAIPMQLKDATGGLEYNSKVPSSEQLHPEAWNWLLFDVKQSVPRRAL